MTEGMRDQPALEFAEDAPAGARHPEPPEVPGLLPAIRDAVRPRVRHVQGQ